MNEDLRDFCLEDKICLSVPSGEELFGKIVQFVLSQEIKTCNIELVLP